MDRKKHIKEHANSIAPNDNEFDHTLTLPLLFVLLLVLVCIEYNLYRELEAAKKIADTFGDTEALTYTSSIMSFVGVGIIVVIVLIIKEFKN